MASPAIQLATAYVSLVVSTQGVGKDVARELGRVETQAQRTGLNAGQKLAAAFNKNKIDTRAQQEQVKRLEETVKRSSKAVADSRQKEEDAARKVAIAQAAYEEAIKKTGETSSRSLSAQDRLITAQRKAEGAAHQTVAALEAEERAMKELGDETNKTEGKVKGFGAKFKSSVQGAVGNVNPFTKMRSHAEKAGKESADGFSAKLKGGLGGLAGGLGKVLGPLAALGGVAAIGGGLKDAISGAGQLEQSVGAVQSIFKGGSDQMLGWSKDASTAVGLTKNEYNELAVLMGSQLKNGGTALDDLGGKTNDLIGVGADLSSMFGGTTADAVGALSSALKGERDPIEKYGVSLKQASIDAKAAELGFEKVGGSLSNEATQAATLALIMEQTKDAHGNFAKESDTYAHKVQVMSARFEDMKVGVGEKLLPILMDLWDTFDAKIMPVLKDVGGAFEGVFNILVKGDYTGGIFGLEEDHPAIDFLFKVREGAERVVELIQGAGKILFQGDFDGGLMGMDEDSPAVGVLFNLRDAGQKLVDAWQNNVMPIVQQVWDTIRGAFEENGPAIEGVVVRVQDAFSKAGTVIENIGGFITSVWTEIGPVVLPIIEGFIGAIVGIWDGLWQSIGGIMDLISAVLTGDWAATGAAVGEIDTGIKNAIGAAFQGMYDTVAGILGYLWSKITGVFSDIGSWTSQKATEIKDGVVNGFQSMCNGAIKWFTDLKDGTVRKAMELKDSVLGSFGNLWTGAEKAFKTGVSTIGGIFNGIRDMAKQPIKFVINTVLNDGLINGVNILAEKVGLGKPLARIPLPKGFTRGGILPGSSRWQNGDDQLIMARQGEGIMVSEALQDPYERKRLLAVNAAAIKGQPLDEVRQHFDGFATGGIVDYRGVRMDTASSKMLYAAEKLYGGSFSPTQGSFRPRTSYSGGTHMGAGAIDIRNTGSAAVAALRRVGAAAWDRTGKGDWMPHIHSIFPVSGLSSSAANQMASYRRGGDGLGGSDNGPSVDVINGLSNIGSKVWDLFTKAGQAVLDFASAPVEMFKDAISGGLDSISNVPGEGLLTEVVKKVPNLVIDGIKDWFMGLVGIDGGSTKNTLGSTKNTLRVRAKTPKGFADGGFTPGGPVLVGERGPEIVNLPRSSYVVPNHRLAGYNGTMVEIKLVDERMRGLIRAEVRQMKKEGAV